MLRIGKADGVQLDDVPAHAGVAVLNDDAHAIAHNKLMLIDGETIITGSFNSSKAAEERKSENLLIIRDSAKLMQAYRENFERHLSHSEAYQRR